MDLHSSKDSADRIFGFQVLRAIGCLGILIAHSCHYAEVNFTSLEPGDLTFPGRIGMLNYVVFFFVLSGFLTARQILGGGTTKRHILGRFWGVYPLYWLSMSIVIIIRLAVYNRVDVSYDFWKSLLILPGDHTFLCTVEWTLQFEMVFYAIVTPFFTKWTRKLYPAFVVIAIGFMVICKVGIIRIEPSWLEYIIIGRDSLFWLFVGSAMYCVLYLIEKRWKFEIRNQKALYMVLVVLMIGSTLILDNYVITAFDYLLLVALLFALIIGFEKLDVSGRTLVVRIGNNSYVIYLAHATILMAGFYLLNKAGRDYSLLIHAVVVLLVIILLSLMSEILRASVKGMKQCMENLPPVEYRVRSPLSRGSGNN